jgi:tryptophanyl-tRNA synthetase
MSRLTSFFDNVIMFIHIGAMRQWVVHQHEYDALFCVVDLHAITADYDPVELRENTVKAAALYIASGIDPDKSKIFIQSHVPAHTELTWLLSSLTPQGWLQRMTQYKDKAQKKDNLSDAPLGLFSYPVLMAADILLYQAELVPVGEDQLQHLELARDIVKRFNHKYCRKADNHSKVFRPPTALVVDNVSRVMSLQDGRSKMSKSADNDNSRINILDSPDVIAAKIKKCKTDSESGVSFENEERAECINLLNIYQAVTDKSKEEVIRDTASLGWGAFKPLLTDAIVSHLTPIQLRYRDIMQDQTYLNAVLADGRRDADKIASETLHRAKDVMGFHMPN